MHLTVIGYSARLDPEIEPSVFEVDGVNNYWLRFVRCQAREDLYWAVKHVVDEVDEQVATLDIFGHGGPGLLQLNPQDGDVVTPREESWGLFARIGKLLTDTADVRLLGCDTAAGVDGPKVLSGVEAALSQDGKARTVWGSLATLNWTDFGPTGFRTDVASEFLRPARKLRTPMEGIRRMRMVSRPKPPREIPRMWSPWSPPPAPVPQGALPGEEASAELQRIAELLAPGYVWDGYQVMPAAVVDDRWSDGGLTFTLCGTRRVVAVCSKETGPQCALFRWLSTTTAPSCTEIKSHLAS